MKNIFTILSIIVAVLLGSCSEQSSQVCGEEKETVPSNKRNPYDYYGELHNEVLDSLFNNPICAANVDELVDATIKAARRGVQGYITTRGGDLTYKDEDDVNDGIVSEKLILEIIDDADNSMETVLSKSDISDKALQLLTDLFAEMGDTIVNTNASYEAIYQCIVDAEEDILAASLNEEEMEQVLRTTSTLRYSAYYWNDKMEEEVSTRGFWNNPTFKKYIIIVCADALGGYLGGAVCSVSASKLAYEIINDKQCVADDKMKENKDFSKQTDVPDDDLEMSED